VITLFSDTIKEQRTENREQRTGDREQGAESKEQRVRNRGQGAER